VADERSRLYELDTLYQLVAGGVLEQVAASTGSEQYKNALYLTRLSKHNHHRFRALG